MIKEDTVCIFLVFGIIFFCLELALYNAASDKQSDTASVELSPGVMIYKDYQFDVDFYAYDVIKINILNKHLYPNFDFGVYTEMYQIPSKYYNNSEPYEYYANNLFEKGYKFNKFEYLRISPQNDHYIRISLRNDYKTTTIYYTIEHRVMNVVDWYVRKTCIFSMILTLLDIIFSCVYFALKVPGYINNNC